MSETEATVDQVVPMTTKGPNGIVGTATPGLTLKQMWAQSKSKLSLKAFARLQVKEGNEIAKNWFSNKAGSLNAVRNDKNVARVMAERTATKASKRKSGKKSG
jgi:hypothetical protein